MDDVNELLGVDRVDGLDILNDDDLVRSVVLKNDCIIEDKEKTATENNVKIISYSEEVDMQLSLL